MRVSFRRPNSAAADDPQYLALAARHSSADTLAMLGFAAADPWPTNAGLGC